MKKQKEEKKIKKHKLKNKLSNHLHLGFRHATFAANFH